MKLKPAISNALGEAIDYTITEGNGLASSRKPFVILGHGVTGHKDRPLQLDVSDALNAAGYDTCRISFSGNGKSGGRFEDSTISKEVNDLRSTIDALAPHGRAIAYIGHSMGGAVGVLAASQDKRIRYLVSLAGMVETKRFAETEFADITPGHGCMWEEPSCPLSQVYMTDLTETIVSTLPAASEINVPWLLIHGLADDVVLPGDSIAAKQSNEINAELLLIEDADHLFSNPEHMQQVTEAIVNWLNRLS